jgi:hypothetical protein
MDGQNHDRNYYASRRRLDDVDRKHVDVLVTRTKVKRA